MNNKMYWYQNVLDRKRNLERRLRKEGDRLEFGRGLAFLRFPVEIKFGVERKLLVTFAQRK